MKTGKSLSVTLLLAALVFAVGVRPAHAAIHIYKVTFTATAQFFPKVAPLGNTQKATGYLIYDTATPNNSQTVQVFTNKTYKFNANGNLLGLIFPSQITISTLDRNNDGFFETANALVGFQSGATSVARSYIGTIPRPPGFKISGVFFNGIARSLKGAGSVVTSGVDRFTVSDTWTFDSLSALPAVTGSNNTNDGVTAVVAYLQGKGFVQGM